jgi:hypothetical protein
MNGLQTALLGVALFCYILYRQCARRPVTRSDFLIPGIGALYLGTRYLGGASLQVHDAVIVLTATLVGIGTGLLCGQMIRVWRDEESGIVYQFGGWRYLVAFLSLLVVRVAMRVVARQWDVGVSAAVLNDAFIGMMIGNYLGRAVNVGARAMALLDWQFDALPSTRPARRARRYV